ncbi:protein NO VEIN domain-containing protein, partial [Paraburkholderia sp. SIMBA_027]|uniref:protein NO VEIN domain-containing protein n=1 Tax=Paraburkholderia sp. SIMBA_027 TaxID=3085770 RepID=UPI00397A993F
DQDANAYESAYSRGAFGADPDEHGAASEKAGRTNTTNGTRLNGENWGFGSRFKGDDHRRRDVTAERQVRRSRMLSYVSRSGNRGNGDEGATSVLDHVSDLIDAASMKAVLSYEQSRGWEPERQPHFNPGFDIVSRSPSGDRRLIEV